ncbi:MAG: hypothetical protein WC718_07120 [Phycisphaerales bacterium]|jgi:hypothetical protein
MQEAALLFQKEVSYLPQSPVLDQSCGNCRWFSDQPDTMPCHLVVNAPTTISREGICQRWAVTPDGSTVNAWVADTSEGNPNRGREMGSEPGEAHEAYEAVESQDPPAKTTVLVEALDMSGITTEQVDRERRAVRQRVIGVGDSKNGRAYPREVLTRAAPLFEGISTFADHPTPQERKERPGRKVREKTGWIVDVKVEEDGLYGTRHFSRNQAGEDVWLMVLDVVEGRAPKGWLGGSINAVGKARHNPEGKLVVESIDAVESVDDVTLAAAKGEFLSLVASADDELTTALLQNLTFEEFVVARPEFVERLKKQWQKVRLTEEVTAAYKERDDAMATANATRAEMDALRERIALQEAEHARLHTQIAAKEADLVRKGLEATLDSELRRAGLPADWEADLREQLLNAPPQDWAAILDRERRKASTVRKAAKVTVAGMARNEHVAVPVTEAFNPLPAPDEDQAAWEKRVYGSAGKGRT